MNESESRIRRMLDPLGASLSKLWAKTIAALRDLRDSDASKKAASALQDLRKSDAGKRAASALHDLRDSDAGKKAASALQDLRKSEPVRKAETTAKRAMHDLRSGSGSGGSGGTTTA